LQHSSNFSPPASWHLPSHHPPILVLAYPFAFFLLLLQRDVGDRFSENILHSDRTARCDLECKMAVWRSSCNVWWPRSVIRGYQFTSLSRQSHAVYIIYCNF
jgi:hypothetical protein